MIDYLVGQVYYGRSMIRKFLLVNYVDGVKSRAINYKNVVDYYNTYFTIVSTHAFFCFRLVVLYVLG